MGGTAKKKGKLLEDLVSALHRVPGATVETRVFLPSIKRGSKRKREVDVLLTAEVLGYPVRIAFSCKNERKKVREGQVSQFLGDLEDIGIPPQCGIVVTPTGFTTDALQMAIENDLRPLVLEGLDESRLAAEVSRALRAFVCFVCGWGQGQYFDASVTTEALEKPGFCLLDAEVVAPHSQLAAKDTLPLVLTRVWELWRDELIPMRFGTYSLFVRVTTPSGERVAEVIVDISVFAMVASVEGQATRVGLRHAQTKRLEKQLVQATVPLPEAPLELRRMTSDQDLERLLERSEVRLVHRIRVPRLVCGASYWPPTKGAMKRVDELRAAGEPITFASVEGPYLSQAWNFIIAPPEAGTSTR